MNKGDGMTKVLAVVSAFILMFTGIHLVQAQADWLITAGKGWGPLYLGMSEEDAVRAIGKQPKKRDMLSGGKGGVIYYDTTTLVFVPSRYGSSSASLFRIEITNQGSATREGVRVGASLFDVIRAYGDSRDTTHLEGPHVLTCLEGLVINQFPCSPIHDVTLYLRYVDRGIEFQFWNINADASKQNLITVNEIDVFDPSEKSECPRS